MTDHKTRDLDTLLSECAPAISEHGPLRGAALEAMARDARPTPRRVRRPLAIGAGAFALLLAGGAAAGAAYDWHVPWQDDAAPFAFALPSGAECNGILGNVQGPADEVAATNAFLGRSNLLDVVDIDAGIAWLRAHPMPFQLADGSEEIMVPGSPHWTADFEYELGFQMAYQDAIRSNLAAQGYDMNSLEGWEAVLTCPNAELPDMTDVVG
ncbi:hypothetical protein [Demequina lutea]|uniref:Uncharacterized protein n=1 Tax=Demequina lutea TaxID=431489 RepID=A0A7Y9ZBB5_9MICO|nr:hypothetical protein [Demequina lutea]NYI42229.1 hypothetical protein [Demequina lutea]